MAKGHGELCVCTYIGSYNFFVIIGGAGCRARLKMNGRNNEHKLNDQQQSDSRRTGNGFCHLLSKNHRDCRTLIRVVDKFTCVRVRLSDKDRYISNVNNREFIKFSLIMVTKLR